MSEEMTDLEIAGYRFRDAELLATALTHSSYLHEHVGKGVRDFERLEFLGDAVVDLVIGEELYRRFPDATEGELTSLRATLVSPMMESTSRFLSATILVAAGLYQLSPLKQKIIPATPAASWCPVQSRARKYMPNPPQNR